MSKRLCKCGCRRELVGRSERCVFWTSACRQRHYRAELKREAEAAGVSTRLSLKTLRSTNATHDRNGDAQNAGRARQKRSRPGASVYLKPQELAAAIAALSQQLEVVDDIDLDSALAQCRRAQARLERRNRGA